MNDDVTTSATIWFDKDGQPVILTSDRSFGESTTDWDRLAAMTDDEIEDNATADPDAQLLTEEQLDRLRPVPNVRDLRTHFQLTQEEFATRFAIPLGTLRDWEQGRSQPDTTARTFLRVISHSPDLVARAVKAS